jgi:sec-independent protein translocase protein TatA
MLTGRIRHAVREGSCASGLTCTLAMKSPDRGGASSPPKRTEMIGDLFDSPWKILIVAVVLIVLFGSTKLPVAARSLGRSMRILKSEVSSLHDDDAEAEKASSVPVPVPVAPQQIAPPVPAPPPAAAEQPTSQEQIDSLQRQIRELRESSVKEAASVPADKKPV